MALFPLTSNFQGDFVLQMIAVDTESTMDQVAETAAYHSVGRRVAPRPGAVMRVRLQGVLQPLPRQQTVAQSGLSPMQCVEIVWDESESEPGKD
jgi:toluene monooxygenase system protein B